QQTLVTSAPVRSVGAKPADSHAAAGPAVPSEESARMLSSILKRLLPPSLLECFVKLWAKHGECQFAAGALWSDGDKARFTTDVMNELGMTSWGPDLQTHLGLASFGLPPGQRRRACLFYRHLSGVSEQFQDYLALARQAGALLASSPEITPH